jgi:uncharacterized protein (TIGR03437 family)
VNASAVGLSLGTYLGTITLTSNTNSSLQIPVTLTVLAPSAPLTVTPSSVALTLAAGQSATQTFTVTSSPSTLFSGPGTPSSPYTPATLQLDFAPTQPGVQYSVLTFTSGSNTVTVPLVLNVTATAAMPPILASVVSAASGLPSPLAPGEIITLYGTGIGATPTAKLSTTLAGTQVLIDNIAAPLIYESSGQVNAIVPFETGTTGTATVQVIAAGLKTAAWEIPLAPSAPSMFTLSGSGLGPGAIVNQDGSINSASNPAPRGSTIQIYATGGGQTTPLSSTGAVAPTAASLSLPVTLTIGGANAQVLYAGNAPSEVEGVIQINAVVPSGATPGAMPVVLSIGGVTSPPVTVFIS